MNYFEKISERRKSYTNMLDENHVLVCLEPVNSTSIACDIRALVLYTSTWYKQGKRHLLKML